MKSHGVNSEEFEVLWGQGLRPREFNLGNPTTATERNRKYYYGVTRKDVHSMLDSQDNKCAICGLHLEYKQVQLDHCHSTGKVRGLLCHKCNKGLWGFEFLLPNLFKVLNYLDM